MAISVNFIRNSVLFIMNKSNLGYVAPQELDIFCNLAQRDIFENLFFQYNQMVNRENRRLTGSEYANLKANVGEQIDYYATYSIPSEFVFNSADETWSFTNNNLYRVENLSLVENTTKKKVDIELVSKRQLNVLVNSDMTAPSLMFPVYEKIGTKFKPAPLVPSGYYLELFYLRTPLAPKWTFITVGGNPIYNPSASDLQDVDLHESLLIPFLTKVLNYAGLSIREPEIAQFVNSEEAKDFQEKQ
jgi:hypothetical protein